MNRHMQQIDHQTGEVVEGFVAYVVPKRKNGFQKGWMAMAQEAMMMLAQSNLTGNDMKVMWAMLARLDYENLIQVNQAEVSEQVGMNRHNVNRSIKKLIELGVILEGVKIGISRSYRLNLTSGGKAQPKAMGGSARALEGYQVIRGRRAHGAALATLPTCAHLSPDSQARLHRAGSVPCKPKTLKMSAYGFVSPTARPPRVLPTPWALPHPRSPRGRGAGKTSCTLTTNVGSPPTCKGQAATRFLPSLDRFPAPSASVSLLPHGDGERVQGRRSRAFTLDALESTQHSP